MFDNLYPGQGLGFTGSKLIAFGLAPMVEVPLPPLPPIINQQTGGGGFGGIRTVNIYDNAYSYKKDDNEIVEILSILFQVIE